MVLVIIQVMLHNIGHLRNYNEKYISDLLKIKQQIILLSMTMMVMTEMVIILSKIMAGGSRKSKTMYSL